MGTEVSAKYRGAFCEAKVKKVNRIVLCKVSFKQVNFQSTDNNFLIDGVSVMDNIKYKLQILIILGTRQY